MRDGEEEGQVHCHYQLHCREGSRRRNAKEPFRVTHPVFGYDATIYAYEEEHLSRAGAQQVLHQLAHEHHLRQPAVNRPESDQDTHLALDGEEAVE